MPENFISTIEKEAKTLFSKLELSGEIKVGLLEDEVYSIELVAQDPQLFIGDRGSVLSDIQYLLRLILKKKTGESIRLTLDINGYRKNKENYLRELARTVADEVSLLKKPRELDPMPPSERRVVHMELVNRNDVVSESVGEEPNRRIVVKPKQA